MRLTVSLLALVAVAPSAFSSLLARQSLPSCATTCLASADVGSCSSSDTQCLCDSGTFINSTLTCAETACSASDLQTAETYAQQLCAAVGVTLTISAPASTSTSTTAAASATSTTTSSSGASMTTSISVFAGAIAALAVAAAL